VKFLTVGFVFFLVIAFPLNMSSKQFPPEIIMPLNGSMEGFLFDDFGPVMLATATLHNPVTGLLVETRPNNIGFYSFDELQAGKYLLYVEAPAHDPVTISDVIVEYGKVTRQDVHMVRIDITESITSTATR